MKRTNVVTSAGLIIVWSILVHLPGVFSPLRDYHAYRQCQTASMARNYMLHGMNFLSPEVDTEGPPVRAGTEFPIYSYLLAVLFNVLGEHDILGRLLSMLFAASGALYLYHLVKARLGETIAFYSALVMCSLPIHIYFTRTVQPEPMALWGMLGFACYADRWLSGFHQPGIWLRALLLGATASLLKLPYLYLILGLWLILAMDRHGWKSVLRPNWLVLIAGIGLLTMAWYHYAKTADVILLPLTPEEHKANLAPIFTLKLWKDQFISRFPELLFTYTGVLFAVLGLYNLRKAKSFRLLLAWSATSVLYVILLGAYGLMHKYTLLPVAPIVAIWIASGISFARSHAQQNRPILALVMVLILGIPLHAALRIKHWYNVEYDYLAAARGKIDEVGKPGDLVVVVTHEKPQHLYYLHRYGYSLEPELWKSRDIDDLLRKGVGFFFVPKFDNEKRLAEWKSVMRSRATLVEENDDYLLYQRSARQG